MQISEEIRGKEVCVVDKDSARLGAVPIVQAMAKAAESNIDLVKIVPQARPPVCKIIDYGKFRFEQAECDKEARENQHVVDTKEIRLFLSTDTHDFNMKVDYATCFLRNGNKVKVSTRFRDREMGHPEQRHQIIQKLTQAYSGTANIEKPSKLEGRNMLMFPAPKPMK